MCRCNDEAEVKRRTVTAKDGRELTVRVVVDLDYDTKDDLDCLSDFDNGIALHCFHKKYRMPHVDSLPDVDSFDSWDEMQAEIESRGLVCFPVSMTDHSGLTCYLGSGRDMWDSGQIGFVVVDPSRHADPLKAAESVTSWFDSILQGEIFVFIVEDESGETLDSVCGFVGDADYCLQEGMNAAACY